MKLKHTKAKKARRASGFHKDPQDGQSILRAMRRESLQPKMPKTHGQQVVRIQRIFLKKDRFGGPIVRFIKHAAMGPSIQKETE